MNISTDLVGVNASIPNLAPSLSNPFIMFHRYLLLLGLVVPMMMQAQEVRVVTRIVTDAAPAWKVWKGNGYSMHYPDQWDFTVPVQGDTMVIFSKGGPDANVRVCVQGMEEMPVTRTDVDQVGTMETSTSRENPRVVYNKEVEGTPMRIMEELISEGGRPFKLTYSAPQGSFDEFLFMAEAMINSFSALEVSK